MTTISCNISEPLAPTPRPHSAYLPKPHWKPTLDHVKPLSNRDNIIIGKQKIKENGNE